MTFLDFLKEINMKSNLVICFNNKEYLKRDKFNNLHYLVYIPDLDKCKIVDIEFLTKKYNDNLKITLV